MTSRTFRSLGVVSLAMAATVALGVAPAVSPAWTTRLKTVLTEAALLDTESWIMGGSGLPIPPPGYLTALSERYVNPTATYPGSDFNPGHHLLFPNQPTFPVSPDNMNALFTPEGLYPLTGVKTLEIDPSVAQGVQILDSKIQQLVGHNDMVVVGYSQSAMIATQEMKNLLDPNYTGTVPDASQLSFVLLGDLNNPDGGLLERFNLPGVPLTIPSIGATFSGATPDGTPWDTAIYTQEYDGFADFPKYPINLLSDINAFMGILFVHGTYPRLTADQIGTAELLPGSKDLPYHLADGTTTAAESTNYFMIPTDTLPILEPLKAIPLIGQPLYNLLEPDMRILVNLGYGGFDADGLTHGWDTGPANEPTPFGLFPSINLHDLVTSLGQGLVTGIKGFFDPDAWGLSAADAAEHVTSAASFHLPSLLDIVNAFSAALAAGYSALLPTADLLNAVLTTLPAYSAEIFLHELSQGHLIDAFGMPIAAGVGLLTMTAGFELEVIENAVSGIADAFKGLF